MVEHIGLEVMTNFTSEGIFEEKWKGIFANLRFNESSGHSRVYYKKLRKKFSGHRIYPVFPRIKARKIHSPFLSREFCRKREKMRGHLLCFIPIRTMFKIRGWEHVSKPFEGVLTQISACSSGTFEVKSDFKHAKGEKWRIALYLRHMVVVVKSARILRLSSILWEVASSRKRRISAEAGPGRLPKSVK